MPFDQLSRIYHRFLSGADGIHHTEVVAAMSAYAGANQIPLHLVQMALEESIPF